MDARDAVMSQCKLNHTDLTDADLREADLRGADLSYARFQQTKIEGMLIAGAILAGIDVTAVGIDLEAEEIKANSERLTKMLDRHRDWVRTVGKQGKRANMRNIDLTEFDLSNRELSGMDFSGSILIRAKLTGCEPAIRQFHPRRSAGSRSDRCRARRLPVCRAPI